MNKLLSISDKLDKFARTIGLWTGWIIIPLILVIMFDVITRKIDITRIYFSSFTIDYGYSISTILQDLEWHFHALLLMFSFGIGYLCNAHVRVDIFREMASRRKQAWIELLGLIILALPFLTLMIMFSWRMVVLSFSQGEGSDSMTGIGMRYIPKSFMVLGFIVVMCTVLATIGRLISYLFGDKAQQEHALDGMSIFTDQSTALEEARLEAERILEEERMRVEKKHAAERATQQQ